ncbi:hypothetical protein [Sinorhizobium saheli]|uniref:hypothetical protein n=1 Tax=Sinorhizobium saheli TaxID=36856 RepID=UPI001296F8C9|nr:hypothetical protein [Sinorhizobium saheli]MQW86013.1 hypothetical protein [Sinorhizobium saheli]
MDKNDELELLRERAHSLDQSIKDIDYEIERWTHALAGGIEPGPAISFLRDCHHAQLGLMYDLGKVDAQIQVLERLSQEEREKPVEMAAVDGWQEIEAEAPEDHLDWLRPALNQPEPQREDSPEDRHPQYEGEDRMLVEMHREDVEPEDYNDWWKGRA